MTVTDLHLSILSASLARPPTSAWALGGHFALLLDGDSHTRGGTSTGGQSYSLRTSVFCMLLEESHLRSHILAFCISLHLSSNCSGFMLILQSLARQPLSCRKVWTPSNIRMCVKPISLMNSSFECSDRVGIDLVTLNIVLMISCDE